MSWHHSDWHSAWHHSTWHHSFGGGDLGHMVVSSVVHGVIYDVIWKAMRGLGLTGSVIVAGVVVGLVWIAGSVARSRRR